MVLSPEISPRHEVVYNRFKKSLFSNGYKTVRITNSIDLRKEARNRKYNLSESNMLIKVKHNNKHALVSHFSSRIK